MKICPRTCGRRYKQPQPRVPLRARTEALDGQERLHWASPLMRIPHCPLKIEHMIHRAVSILLSCIALPDRPIGLCTPHRKAYGNLSLWSVYSCNSHLPSVGSHQSNGVRSLKNVYRVDLGGRGVNCKRYGKVRAVCNTFAYRSSNCLCSRTVVQVFDVDAYAHAFVTC